MPLATHARTQTRSSAPPKGSSAPQGSVKVLWLPFALALALAAFPVFFSRVGDYPALADTFWVASGALLLFVVILRWRAMRAQRALHYEVLLNKVHYVQLIMHTCVYTYWGWYWREVYHYVPLIAAQIIFVYALDMLVCWSRREKWLLGFGPFPIVLSTNLFLWFRDDWFYLQFLMLATGVLGKEFIKWKREGRLVHIFNPSALSLFIFSVGLIATRSTDMTWGIEIADTLHRPPHIYLEIFFLGLIVQSLFRVTLVTLFSAVALYAMNLAYTRITGDFNFVDSNIPVSVFLGLHLLVTDPATSPRKNFGKILFGLMYGAGVFGMYRFLSLIHAPEFYDKLLCVPALNLTVRGLDRLSEGVVVRIRSFISFRALSPQNTNFAWMGVWIALFATMMTTGFLTKGKAHPGGDPEYWHRACLQGRANGCDNWTRALNVNCESNARDCVKLGEALNDGKLMPRRSTIASVIFGRGCDLGSAEACSKLIEFAKADGKDAMFDACSRGDGANCFILGSLYSSGSGVPQDPSRAFDLFRKSCDAGWWRGCGRIGTSYLVGQGTPVDPLKAIENFEKGCKGRNAASCFEVARLYWQGTGGERQVGLAEERLNQACQLGLQAACEQARSIALRH